MVFGGHGLPVTSQTTLRRRASYNTISFYPVTVCYCWRSCVKNFTLSRCRSAGFTRSDFQRKKKNKREREKKINNISCDGCACAGSFRLQIDDQRIDNDAASTLNTWNISVSIDFDWFKSHTRAGESGQRTKTHEIDTHSMKTRKKNFHCLFKWFI